MTDSDADALLGRPVPPRPDDGFRDRLLARTAHAARPRHWLRRLAAAAALAACFAAGRLSAPVAESETVVVVEVLAKRPPADAPASPVPVDPYRLELDAETASTAERTARFRAAGDAFAKLGLWDASLRCYRNALDTATADELEVAPDDNWLFMNLKIARKMERRDAKRVQ